MAGAADAFDWNDLRVLREVLRHGSLSQAASALGMSQPTVGRRLSQLEEALGGLLVERSVATRPA